MKPVGQWVLDREMFFACLSRHGLSTAEIALADAIAQPGQSVEDLAVVVRSAVRRVNNAMTRRGLYAGIKVRRKRKVTV